MPDPGEHSHQSDRDRTSQRVARKRAISGKIQSATTANDSIIETMFDDLSAYYYENVAAAFIEYRDTSKDGVAGRSRDIRGAIDAATALFHLREHLPAAGMLTRAEVERRCPDYALLGDVVNAAKHKTISHSTPHGSPLVTDATSLTEKLLMIEYSDADGVYRCTQKSVVAVLANGLERNLLEVLTNVVNFWESYLHSLGVLSVARAFRLEPQVRYRTRAECEQIRLNFEIVQGQRFKQTMQLLRFDQTTGTASPIDLTGSQLRFSIYKPRFDFEVSLRHEASGRELTATVPLSEDESAVLAGLKSDDERQAYATSLPAAQEALRGLAEQPGLLRASEKP